MAETGNTVSTSDKQTASQDGSKQSLAADIRAQMGAAEAEVQGQGESGGASLPETSPLAGEILIDLGDGVTKKVKAEDLVAALKGRAAAEEKSRVADQRFKEVEALRGIGEQLGSMTPEQRQLFAEALKNPDVLSNGKSSSDEELKTLLNGTDESQESDMSDHTKALFAAMKHENAEIRGDLDKVLNHLNGRIDQEQKVTLADNVSTAMDAYPVFTEDTHGTAMTKDAIMNAMALDPEQDVDALVAQNATKLHDLYQSQRRGSQPTPAARGFQDQEPVFHLPDLDKPFTAEQMQSGEIRETLSDALRRSLL